MKSNRVIKRILLFFLLLLARQVTFSQGKVVINEYMPWPGCATTSEYIELLNFGPGPMDISCYIVTNGQYSVTLPAHTIILPGKYFLLAGQDLLAKGCGNNDSAVHVQLNWNTCNCTNKPIPTTGDGFMPDGGSANEKVVLLDPNLKVVDAVTRKLPVSASTAITTATTLNGCASKTFNLGTMAINYETLGMSTGKANSFSRQIDGDCNWVKTPQQSAGATNKTGSSSSITYNLTTTESMDCNGKGGSVVIDVSGNNINSLFPMNYTLAYDVDNNRVFDFTDQYTTGVDDTPPSININGLKAGNYNITVSSVLDCDLQTLPVTILGCYPLLPVQLVSFGATRTAQNEPVLNWKLQTVENLKQIGVEQSTDGTSFSPMAVIQPAGMAGEKSYRYQVSDSHIYYRLRIESNDGHTIFSPIININGQAAFAMQKLWPNPVRETATIELFAATDYLATYTIYSVQNALVQQGRWQLHSGKNAIALSVSTLPAGTYQLLVSSPHSRQPISFRFVK